LTTSVFYYILNTQYNANISQYYAIYLPVRLNKPQEYRNMPIPTRQQQILNVLKKFGSVSVVELTQELGVSPNTIRSDLDNLAEQGFITRTHGGATLLRPGLPPQLWPQHSPIPTRVDDVVSYTLSWIQDGDTLFIDSSPFCIRLVERMAGFHNLRVITTSLPAAFILSQESTNTVVIAGGEFDFDRLSTGGGRALAAIREFHADKAFLSCSGVSLQSGITDQTSESAEIRRAMKEAADSVFVLVESERVGKAGLFPIGSLDEARRIITDQEIDSSAVQMLADAGARLSVCWEGGHQTYRRKFSLGRTARIGFANLSHGVDFANKVMVGIQQAARQVDGLELLIADNQTNPETAVRNAKEFISQDIDLLVEYEGTGLAIRPIRSMMREADVPVIAIDIPIMGATHLGSDHDAAGACAGEAVGKWIRQNWGGQVDLILWLTSEGGATITSSSGFRFENWQHGQTLSESLSPAARFASALDTLQKHLTIPEQAVQPKIQQLILPGGWTTSYDAVRLHFKEFSHLLPEIPADKQVAVLCLVGETALGFAQAVRSVGRCHQFVVAAFGDINPAILEELANPGSCLLGVVNLHPDRYGEKVISTAVKLLKGEPVPPAVFIEHEFISREEVHDHEKENRQPALSTL
jgi:DeoR/GlpR family transcriptional regulator of sugar metabolism/ABC-type sugar transport system substrate-binding protein